MLCIYVWSVLKVYTDLIVQFWMYSIVIYYTIYSSSALHAEGLLWIIYV